MDLADTPRLPGNMADYLLNALVTLFVTIDPIGLGPIFLALTRGMSPAVRREVALRASIIAGAVLLVFALVGEGILSVLGISIPAFRIAGGLLLFWIAFEMVFERREERKKQSAEKAVAEDHLGADDARHIAVFPLAIPLISGPGAISATILLASSAPGATGLVLLLVILALLITACLLVFLVADRLDHVLGETGRSVLTRLLGVLLAALSVQFVADGVQAFAQSMVE